jgi:PHD/YefM family antitoxin component YafN of YafNO toxin-antitoxin module
MFEIHHRPSRELRNNYRQLAQIVRDHNDVVITNNGEIDVIMVNPADWKEFKQFRYNQYILKKLKEVEIVADDPSTWLSEEEFWGKVNKL